MKKCPQCKRFTLNPTRAMNSLSRRDGKTYICNACGDNEAMIDYGSLMRDDIDLGEIKPDDIEKKVIKKHKRPQGMIRS